MFPNAYGFTFQSVHISLCFFLSLFQKYPFFLCFHFSNGSLSMIQRLSTKTNWSVIWYPCDPITLYRYLPIESLHKYTMRYWLWYQIGRQYVFKCKKEWCVITQSFHLFFIYFWTNLLIVPLFLALLFFLNKRKYDVCVIRRLWLHSMGNGRTRW